MFDGTDLSMAYGSMYEVPSPPPQHSYTGHGGHAAPPPPKQEELPLPQSTTPHALPPEVPYNPPPAMYATQPAAKVPQYPSDNFWDKLVAKKWDVVKLIVLGLVVLLGISMDRVGSHYLNGYISKAFLTDTQEFLVRISYPIMVILVLWVIKASA